MISEFAAVLTLSLIAQPQPAAATAPAPSNAAPAEAPVSAAAFAKRYAGKALLSVSLVGSAGAGWAADFNDTHVFNPEWEPHARFHNMVGIIGNTGLALVGLWALWRDSDDPLPGRVIAAAVPIMAWAPFFIATLTPGGFEDPDDPLPRVLGIPINLFVAACFVTVSALGFTLDTLWGRSAPPAAMRQLARHW